MVSVKQLEDNYYLQKQNSSSELSKCSQLPLNGDLSGIKIPIYQLRARDAKKIGSDGGTTWNAEEEQSILDSLLLAQWEDRAWKGLLRYDVTACETRVISGGRKFIAQLSKEWKSKCVPNLEEFKTLQQVDLFKFNCMKTLNEELLFCVASGAKAKSELITSSAMPNDANLVIINANPVEYGHVFFVPINFHLQDQTLDSRSLELVTVVSSEINNCSFCVFYDCPSTRSVNHPYFQGCYFANHLPVEFAQFVPIAGVWQERGIQICEVADYPVKALLFSSSHNSKALVDAVSEICSYLQDQSIPFSLLISDCGMKIFLFPKVLMLAAECDLSAWECGGHFIFKCRSEFNQATEAALAKQLSSVSLDNDAFQSMKQQCCIVASKKLNL